MAHDKSLLEMRGQVAALTGKEHSGSLGVVLHVDDDKFLRRGVERLLGNRGYEVISAQNGPMALDLLAEHDVDAVLLDLTMPDMDGIEVLRVIRESYSRLEMPVLIATAANSPERVVACFEAGANDFVSKPFNTEVVSARLQAHMLIRATHEALKASWDKAVGLVEYAEDMLFQLDDNGHYTFVSPACAKMLGYSPAELLGQPEKTLIHPQDTNALEDVLDEDSVSSMVRMRTKEGEYLWVETRRHATRDGGDAAVEGVARVASGPEDEKKEVTPSSQGAGLRIPLKR